MTRQTFLPLNNYYIRTTELIGFAELIERMGGDAKALLSQAGLPVEPSFSPGELMSLRGFTQLHEIAASELNRPSFALEWVLATPPHFPNLGPLAYLGYFSRDIRDWIETGLCYWRLHCNGFTMQLFEDLEGPVAVFRFKNLMPVFPMRQGVEHALGNIVTLSRIVGGRPDENPSLVRFQHSAPRDLSLHERVFCCPIEFGAEHDEIHFDKRILDYATSGQLMFARKLMQLYIRSRLRAVPTYNQSVRATVALAIESLVGTRRCTAEFIAESLGFSPKALQRMLSAEGTSFSEILDDARKIGAREMLRNSNATVSQISALLGYAAPPAFVLAFRRWQGVSPTEYRSAMQNDAQPASN